MRGGEREGLASVGQYLATQNARVLLEVEKKKKKDAKGDGREAGWKEDRKRERGESRGIGNAMFVEFQTYFG